MATANNLHVANSILENQPVGSEVADLDKMLHNSVYGIGDRIYQMVLTKLANSQLSSNTNVDEIFELEGSKLALRKSVDREAICPNAKPKNCVLETSIFVHQMEPKQVEFMLVLETTVNDINDNEPTFPLEQNFFKLNISEGDPIGTRYNLPEATDADSSDYGIKNYTIEGPQNALSYFKLVTSKIGGTSVDPQLELVKSLDREVVPNLQIRLVVADKGTPALSSTMTIDITVLDENDNTPQFEKMEYLESLQESYDVNGVVTNVRATDRDQGDNARISYFIDDSASSPSERGIFVIPNPSVGQVRLAKPLDYEQWSEHRFKVVAVDHGKIPRTGSTLVTIRVLDVNDQPPTIVTYPTIPNNDNNIIVKENSPVHTAVAVVKIKEPDGATSQQAMANAKYIDCHLQDQEIPRSFYLVAIEKGSEYILKSNATFDREIRPSITVQIQCVNRLDAGSKLVTTNEITVNIIDENDNAPMFEKGNYQTVSFLENSAPGTAVHQFVVTDLDTGDNSNVKFKILASGNENAPFSINSDLGLISVTDVLDRERKSSYQLKVVASDDGEVPLSTTCTLIVNLVDENDNSPQFERDIYNFLLPNDLTLPYRITQFSVSDRDEGDNAIVRIKVDEKFSAMGRKFSVDSSGALFLNEPIAKWDHKEPIEIAVKASDMGSPKRQTEALVKLYMVGKADSSLLLLFPTKTNYTLPVPISLLKSALGLDGAVGYMNQMPPPAIGNVMAVTDDNYVSQGAFLSYELLNSNSNKNQQSQVPGASPILFRINKTSGAIHVDTVAMAAAAQQQQQVPVVVNPGDRYSLAVVVRLSVPPFNKSFVIERFNRLDIVFQDTQNLENRMIGTIEQTSPNFISDIRNIGLVIGLAIFAGLAALIILFMVVFCRKKSSNSFRSGSKSITVGSGCGTGHTSPCGSSSSKQTTCDTKPLSVEIVGSEKQHGLAGQFQPSMFPVERLKLSCSRVDENGSIEKSVEHQFGTLRRGSSSKLNSATTTPRIQHRPLVEEDCSEGSPNTLDVTTTSPLSDKQQQTSKTTRQECSSSSISSHNSSSHTSSSSSSNKQDQDSGRDTEEFPSASTSTNTVPRSILVMKSPMPPRPSALYTSQNCAQYHVYPRAPPSRYNSSEEQNDGSFPTGNSYPRLPNSNSSVSSPIEVSSHQYFMFNHQQQQQQQQHQQQPQNAEYYLDTASSADEMAIPPSASGCPVHGGEKTHQAPPPPPPPYRQCPVHGHVIPVGGEATFSPTTILRNHHNTMMTGHHHHHLSQQMTNHHNGTML